MRKTLALFLAVVLLTLTLVGCAQDRDVTAQQPLTSAQLPPETATETTLQIEDELETPTGAYEAATAVAARTVTDQLGREVVIPEIVSSVAVSHGPMLNMVVALGGGDLIVGTGPKPSGRTIFDTVAPNVMDAPQIGQQVNLNLEELASINPDLFVLSVRNRDMLSDLDMLEIPGVAIDPEILRP
ncbi:MAG: hypothetical protein FWC75_00540 [Oscillospiraceae bacterium]|nr:hypothetical protein [Oscillospiraceae bacterium]